MANSLDTPLPIQDCDVAYIKIDFAFTLVLSDKLDDFELRINTAFLYIDQAGTHELDAEESPKELGVILAIRGDSVSWARAHRDGGLEVLFKSGKKLMVDYSDDYEAWQLLGPGGLRMISMPGGELAVWERRES